MRAVNDNSPHGFNARLRYSAQTHRRADAASLEMKNRLESGSGLRLADEGARVPWFPRSGAIVGRARVGRGRRIVMTMDLSYLRARIVPSKMVKRPSGAESAEGSQLVALPLIYPFRNLIILS